MHICWIFHGRMDGLPLENSHAAGYTIHAVQRFVVGQGNTWIIDSLDYPLLQYKCADDAEAIITKISNLNWWNICGNAKEIQQIRAMIGQLRIDSEPLKSEDKEYIEKFIAKCEREIQSDPFRRTVARIVSKLCAPCS